MKAYFFPVPLSIRNRGAHACEEPAVKDVCEWHSYAKSWPSTGLHYGAGFQAESFESVESSAKEALA